MDKPTDQPGHFGTDPQRQLGVPRETLLDRQIREAAEEGRFDNLPYQGKPLPVPPTAQKASALEVISADAMSVGTLSFESRARITCRPPRCRRG